MFFSWTVFSGTSVLVGEFMVTLHPWLGQGGDLFVFSKKSGNRSTWISYGNEEQRRNFCELICSGF